MRTMCVVLVLVVAMLLPTSVNASTVVPWDSEDTGTVLTPETPEEWQEHENEPVHESETEQLPEIPIGDRIWSQDDVVVPGSGSSMGDGGEVDSVEFHGVCGEEDLDWYSVTDSVPEGVLEVLKERELGRTLLIISEQKPAFLGIAEHSCNYGSMWVAVYSSDFKASVMKWFYERQRGVESVEYNSTVDVASSSSATLGSTSGTGGYLMAVEPKEQVIVAVLDTGIADSVEFENRVIRSATNVSGSGATTDISDGNSHGTMVTELIYHCTNEYVGILPVKVAGADGQATVLSTFVGIQTAVASGADVINLSMSATEAGVSAALQFAIDSATDAGVYVVVPAGNDGGDVDTYSPACIESAITVSAVDDENEFSSYSNFGSSIDYCARGNYRCYSGTSFASARVAAVLASIKTAGFDPISVMNNFAYDLGEHGRDDKFGIGLITTGIGSTPIDAKTNFKEGLVFDGDGYVGVPLSFAENLTRTLAPAAAETHKEYCNGYLSDVRLVVTVDTGFVMSTDCDCTPNPTRRRVVHYNVLGTHVNGANDVIGWATYAVCEGAPYGGENHVYVRTKFDSHVGEMGWTNTLDSSNAIYIINTNYKRAKAHCSATGDVRGHDVNCTWPSDYTYASNNGVERGIRYGDCLACGKRLVTEYRGIGRERYQRVDGSWSDYTVTYDRYHTVGTPLTYGTADTVEYVGTSWAQPAPNHAIVLDVSRKRKQYKQTHNFYYVDPVKGNVKFDTKVYTEYYGATHTSTNAGVTAPKGYKFDRYNKNSWVVTGDKNDSDGYVFYVPNGWEIEYQANGGYNESTYDPNGVGTDEDFVIVKEYSLVQNCKIEGVLYKRPGYTFTGWNTKANGTGTSYVGGGSYSPLTTTPGGLIKLYAQWDANHYTIKFNANGGAGSAMQPIAATYDSDVKLASNTFSRAHYVFNGWNTRADGNGVQIFDSATVGNLTTLSNGVVTLYAQWQPIVHSVTYTYESNGGTGCSKKEAVSVAETQPITLDETAWKDVAGEVWQFVGWSIRPDSKEVVSSLVMGEEDVTLYAVYKKDISVMYYDAANPDGYRVTKTVWNNESSAQFNRDVAGYTDSEGNDWDVVGWCIDTDPDAETCLDFNFCTDKRLFAKYERETSAVFHNFNGDDIFSFQQFVNSSNFNRYSDSVVVAPDVATKANWEIAGWASDADSTTAEFRPGQHIPYSGEEYYAVYYRPYTITFVGAADSDRYVERLAAYYSTSGKYIPAELLLTDAREFTADSRVFRSWNLSPRGTGTEYRTGDTIRVTRDTTLYAMFDDVSASSIVVDSDSVTLMLDEELTINARVEPENSRNKGLVWESADQSIATVSSDGVVRGVSSGTTAITITSKGNPSVQKVVYVQVVGVIVTIPKVVVLNTQFEVSVVSSSPDRTAKLYVESLSKLTGSNGEEYQLSLLRINGSKTSVLDSGSLVVDAAAGKRAVLQVSSVIPIGSIKRGKYSADLRFRLEF